MILNNKMINYLKNFETLDRMSFELLNRHYILDFGPFGILYYIDNYKILFMHKTM